MIGDSIIAVSTSPIQGANAGGNGVYDSKNTNHEVMTYSHFHSLSLGAVGLWTCSRPFVPISIVEGHQEGAVTAFVFVSDDSTDSDEPSVSFNRRSTEPTSSGSPDQRYSRRRLSEMHDAAPKTENYQQCKSIILSVGRDGQCLLQDFSLGELWVLFMPGIGTKYSLSIECHLQVKNRSCKCPNLHSH